MKRKLFTFFLLKFSEVFEVLKQKFKHYFTKKVDKFNGIKTKLINNINSEESIAFFNEGNFDLIVSINCNQIIKKNTLDKVPIDFVNFHPGKLPNYRGLFPSFYSLLNKEREVCLSFHKIDAGIDTEICEGENVCGGPQCDVGEYSEIIFSLPFIVIEGSNVNANSIFTNNYGYTYGITLNEPTTLDISLCGSKNNYGFCFRRQFRYLYNGFRK